ncbi:MAG: RluA family pseudouridine synthase [Spirochaetes bacterium]|nr:RluA family pseudouridine synthase [Spirochaetota bacterium]
MMLEFSSILSSRFRILYEDEWYLAIDKPPGLLTIPAPGNKKSLTELLDLEGKRAGVSMKLHPCHRLDGETSGVLLFAKGKKAQKLMMERFHEKNVHKLYIALVQGGLEKEEGLITRVLEGKPALTRYRVLERLPLCTLVEVEPETGRTNQIRLHFKGIGHPLVGETRFAFRKDFPLSIPRLMLHAQELTFPHPMHSSEITIRAPLPSDMEKVLERIRNG